MVATGKDSLYKSSKISALKYYSVRTIMQRKKTQTSLRAALRYLGDVLERWSNVTVLLTSSRTGFLIATRMDPWHQTGLLRVSSRPLSGSRTPETMTAR